MSIRKILLLIVIVLFASFIFKDANKKYEYIDYDNNRDISRKCYVDTDGFLYCIKNGKLVKVKQFNRR